jgi:iron(III) transport system permease protein
VTPVEAAQQRTRAPAFAPSAPSVRAAGPGLATTLFRRLPGGAMGITYVATFVATALLVMVPLVSLIYGSLRTASPGLGGTWTLANWLGLGSDGVVGTLWNTCVIAVLTAVFSTLYGGLVAWITCRTDFRFKRSVTVLVGLSFFFPGFILAMAWIIIGSPGGLINVLLNDVLHLESVKVDIYSLAGIVWIQTLHLTPFAFYALRGPLMSMDASFEEAAYMAGASTLQTCLRVTLPLMIYPLLSATLLSFVLSVEQFAIPAMVGIPGHVGVLATQLYLLTSFSPPNHGLAAAIGLALSALTGLSILAQRWVVRRYGAASITGKSYRLRQLPLGGLKPVAYMLCFGYVLLAFVIPAATLIYTSLIKFFVANPFEAAWTLRNYTHIYQSPATIRAFTNTVIVSAGGALIGLMLGTLVAYSTQRLRPAGHRLLDLLASLPFGIPGVVIGLGFLWSFVYLPIYGTLWVLIFCYLSRFMPYATETVGAQIVQIDRSLEEAAWTSGASRLQTLLRVVLPLLRPALQSAYCLLFIAYFREIASAVLLYTSKTAVISISIWSFFENANWGSASALSVVSSVIIIGVMATVSRHLFRPAAAG